MKTYHFIKQKQGLKLSNLSSRIAGLAVDRLDVEHLYKQGIQIINSKGNLIGFVLAENEDKAMLKVLKVSMKMEFNTNKPLEFIDDEKVKMDKEPEIYTFEVHIDPANLVTNRLIIIKKIKRTIIRISLVELRDLFKNPTYIITPDHFVYVLPTKLTISEAEKLAVALSEININSHYFENR